MSERRVQEDDVRPARPDGTCFYCKQAIGEDHATECVLLRHTVRVRIVAEIPMEVPENWDTKRALFWLNLGSRCKFNSIDRLVGMFGDDVSEEDYIGCGCEHITHEVYDEETKTWMRTEEDWEPKGEGNDG